MCGVEGKDSTARGGPSLPSPISWGLYSRAAMVPLEGVIRRSREGALWVLLGLLARRSHLSRRRGYRRLVDLVACGALVGPRQ